MGSTVERFCRTFNEIDSSRLELLDAVYDPEVHFADPFHTLAGLNALKAYMARSYANVISCRFDFEPSFEREGEAFVAWTMHLRHPRLRWGETVTVPGVSHLRFGKKVAYHRDYFDAGAMLYEQIPCVGGVIRRIKSRL